MKKVLWRFSGARASPEKFPGGFPENLGFSEVLWGSLARVDSGEGSLKVL